MKHGGFSMKKTLIGIPNTALITLTLTLSSHFVFALGQESFHESLPDKISLSNAALNPEADMTASMPSSDEIGNASAEEFLVNPEMNSQELSVESQHKIQMEAPIERALSPGKTSTPIGQKTVFSLHAQKTMIPKTLRHIHLAVSEKISDAVGSVWAKFFDNENSGNRQGELQPVRIAYGNGKTQNIIGGNKRAKFNLEKYRETPSGINSQRPNNLPAPIDHKASKTKKWAQRLLVLTGALAALSAGTVYASLLPLALVFPSSWAFLMLGNMIGPRAMMNAASKGEKPISTLRLAVGSALMLAGAGGIAAGFLGLISATGLISAHAAASALPFDTPSSQASRTLIEWLFRGAVGGGLIASVIDLAKNFFEKIPAVSGKLIHAKINWIVFGLYLLVGLGLGAVLGLVAGSFAVIL